MGYIKLEEVVQTVDLLNDEWEKAMEARKGEVVNWPRPFGVVTDGVSVAVSFLEVTLWCDEDDARNYNEEKDEYEPLGTFLKREVRAIARDITSAFPEVAV